MGSAAERHDRQEDLDGAGDCDICGERIGSEPAVDGGGEVAHVSCVAWWFRANFGREGLV